MTILITTELIKKRHPILPVRKMFRHGKEKVKEQIPKKGKPASEKQKTAMTLCVGIAVLCVVVYSQFPELKELGYVVLLAGGIFLGVALGILVYSRKKQGDNNSSKKIVKKKKRASAIKKENNMENQSPYFGDMPQRSMQEEPIRKTTQNDYGKTVLLSKTSIV